MKKIFILLWLTMAIAPLHAQNGIGESTVLRLEGQIQELTTQVKELQGSVNNWEGRFANEVKALQLEFKGLEGELNNHLIYLLVGIATVIGGFLFIRGNVLKQTEKMISEAATRKVREQLPGVINEKLTSEVQEQLGPMVEKIIFVNAEKFRSLIHKHEQDTKVKSDAKLVVVGKTEAAAEVLKKLLVEEYEFPSGNIHTCSFPIPSPIGKLKDHVFIFQGLDNGVTPEEVETVVSKPGRTKYFYLNRGRASNLDDFNYKMAFANSLTTFPSRLIELLKS